MAGAGIKLFSTGAVLTAAQVNTYLMDQTIHRFATTSDRSSAYSAAGVTLAEGMFSYIDATNKLYFYTGSAWEEVGAQIEAGEVTNTEIAVSAGISLSKLASGTAGYVVLANGSGVPTYTSITGDISVTDAGVTAISSGVIVDADVNASAAIAKSKIADVSISNKVADYTLSLTDKNKIIEMEVSSANTLTVPPSSTANFAVGAEVTVVQYGSGKTQIAAGSGVTIRATPGLYLRARYSSATLIKRATDEWYLIGDLSAS